MISSSFSRASFNRETSVGYLISAGAQVASNINLPCFFSSLLQDLLSPEELEPELLSWSSESSEGDSFYLVNIISLISQSISAVIRLRKCTIRDESNGFSTVYSVNPIKYCRYGFSRICSTVSSSV